MWRLFTHTAECQPGAGPRRRLQLWSRAASRARHASADTIAAPFTQNRSSPACRNFPRLRPSGRRVDRCRISASLLRWLSWSAPVAKFVTADKIATGFRCSSELRRSVGRGGASLAWCKDRPRRVERRGLRARAHAAHELPDSATWRRRRYVERNSHRIRGKAALTRAPDNSPRAGRSDALRRAAYGIGDVIIGGRRNSEMSTSS